MSHAIKHYVSVVRIQRGDRGPDPPGKSQVIWVSIGNKQLDPLPPPYPWKKLDPPPPPLENVGFPLGP